MNALKQSSRLTVASSPMVVNVCQALFQCSEYMCNFIDYSLATALRCSCGVLLMRTITYASWKKQVVFCHLTREMQVSIFYATII